MARPDDGIGDRDRPSVPVPPHYQSQYDAAHGALIGANADALMALDDKLNEARTALTAADSAARQAMYGAIGTVEADLLRAATPVNRAVESQVRSAERAIVEAQVTLDNSGVPMPRTPEDAAMDVLDQSGERAMQRLQSARPDDAAEGPTTDAPFDVPLVSIGGALPDEICQTRVGDLVDVPQVGRVYFYGCYSGKARFARVPPFGHGPTPIPPPDRKSVV